MKDNDTVKAVLLLLAMPTIIGGIIIAMIPISLFRAWVLQQLYKWFLLPLGLPHLNIWQIWGILLIVGLVTYDSNKARDKDSKWWSPFLGHVVAGLLTLLIGFIIQRWV
jgi:hypothetical protein